MLLGKYVYPAKFLIQEDGITVTFPDFDYLITEGTTIADAIEKASECLGMGLHDMFVNQVVRREPSEPKHIHLEKDEIITFISVDLDQWMLRFGDTCVRKNISLPAWLFTMAKDRKLNVSEITQKALMDVLNIKGN